MKVGEHYFLDTNILLSATDAKRSFHDECLRLVEDSSQQGAHIAISGQTLREYHVVATRPVESNGFGMNPRLALDNARAFMDRCVFCEEGESTYRQLRELLNQSNLKGKKTHDANIIATMHSNRIERLVTLNPRDFSMFKSVRIFSPKEALEER